MTKDSKSRSDDATREAHSSSRDHKHRKDKKDKKERKQEKSHKRDKDSSDRIKPVVEITTDDYFTKSEEFRVWLKLKKNLTFESLTTKDSHKLFEKDFVKDYNRGKLDKMYYDGNIPLDIRESVIKTQHKWGFKLTANDKIQLSDLTEDVDKLTRDTGNTTTSATSTSSHNVGGRNIGPSFPIYDSSITGSYTANRQHQQHQQQQHSAYDADNRRDDNRAQYAAKRHAEKKQVKNFIQENAPREEKDGHARMIDARKTKGDAIHGAHRAKEEERDGLNISESVLMGGDTGNDYARMLERSKYNQERKLQKTTERAMELQAKQSERDANFMAALGIDPTKGRIMIQPRSANN